MINHLYQFCLIYICLLGLVGCTTKPGNILEEGPSPAQTPAQELTTFKLEPGLKIQLVAAEPLVQDPVVITFDADGRLWVVEMRGFMPDINGTGEKEPIGRISVLTDSDGDGKMDASRIFLDSLVMPRALALVPGGALVAHNEALWLAEDFNHDLKADKITLIDKDYAGSPLPEHAGNGLWRGLDNWYYNAKSRYRYRLQAGKWVRDSTEYRGQWGISHDDEGRLYYNYNWSQLHADLVPPNYLSRNKNHRPTTGIDHGLTIDRRIYPIRPNPAVNRGYIPGTLDEAGRLREFTAACSPLFYRGTALPPAYYGNVFVCEPSGNLIKRNLVTEADLLLSAKDPHPGTEFLASTDERFRPVHLATGPDGALYIADMYRGLVQHGAYITPYLREQTLSRKLVQPINRGRIWRVVPENWQPTSSAKLSGLSAGELVPYLSHPNGWHRDMAQRLLVERNDQDIIPALTQMALTGKSEFGRLHALWALAGMQVNSPEVYFKALDDGSLLIRTSALRLLEPLARENKNIRSNLGTRLMGEWENTPIKQILQTALTARVLEPEISHQLLAGISEKYNHLPLMRDAILSSLDDQEFVFLERLWKLPGWQIATPGKEIFLEMLATAIIRKHESAELASLLALLEQPDQNKKAYFGWQHKAVLTGLSMGGLNKQEPMQLTSAPAIFKQAAGKLDASRLAAVTDLFRWPGHNAAVNITQQKNILNEEQQQQFALGRQHYLTSCAGCHSTNGAGMSRFAPPLVGSDWVLGDEKRLALILLHGLEGPVEVAGKIYDAPEILPVMPAHSTLDDATITAILTYIRNEWGNQAGPVGKRTVGSTRNTSQGRVSPWKPDELNNYISQSKNIESK
ncbi:dehydrogenase [Adhaeribacter aerolatus]|uniref:Dehydrogenase n=1 Tax=Adhaeribacter aerolatus TaxID=670289 RepID=A0A512AXG3_9BACT|nr:c-type cytochrome [Adhaeribacter aerolatus]GEO04370.1 dehydrogenase [Adhaeribacter aerolatus]